MICGKRAIIFECGSGYCKSGYAGEKRPSNCFPFVIGIPKQLSQVDNNSKEFVFGDDAINRQDKYKLYYPLQDAFLKFLNTILENAIYCLLHAEPSKQPVVFVEFPFCDISDRKRIAQIMFNEFKVPALYLLNSFVASLNAYGLNTGVIFESGKEIISIVPVCNGKVIEDATKRIALSDGCELSIEDYFKRPILIHKMIYNSIMKCAECCRQELFSNIFLSMNQTMTSDSEARLFNEITTLVHGNFTVKIKQPPSDWAGIGASLYAQSEENHSKCITREQFAAIGDSYFDLMEEFESMENPRGIYVDKINHMNDYQKQKFKQMMPIENIDLIWQRLYEMSNDELKKFLRTVLLEPL